MIGTRPRWGTSTPTRIARLGECPAIVQRLPDEATARRTIDNARLLAEASLPGPNPIGPARGRFVAWTRAAGTPGPLLLGGAAGEGLAREMGRLARQIGDLPADTAAVDSAWRTPAHLGRAAVDWLDRLAVEAPEIRERRAPIRISIDRVAGATWSPRPTHGDFAPANVLVRDGRVAALLDVSDLALRHPEVDVAWWELIVRFHHPGDADRLARELRRAYGADGPGIAQPLRDVAAIRALQLAAAPGAANRPRAVTLVVAAITAATG